ncbi:Gfo/Idh/MocA family oxidoreductase [Paenibacillus sp. J5C_2022]|uniref:Gfo/Idh/MocA family protein n=1 Tax=Paenibacillus sp. J5C2022 TaxID=2977129 RepID=UPI0021CE055A|nr:Gfo/Idh/MocA family oxidoreductase [Paenibacillus sp. J5C2022]MCU6712941.1 Gfo/Idh/MocA family oxidoreductase [Paenibacillus sp. J5C2022]
MSATIHFGIVGCGYFGSGFARTISKLEGVKTVAVHGGTRAQSLADELGCDAYENLEEMLVRSDLDAIIVASPNHAHKEAVVMAAKYGKHVFCEKPFALSIADCDEMIAACRDNGVVLMAGHIMHFMNGVQQVKRWIEAGEIGRPIVIHAERTGWEERQREVSWKKQLNSSGGHLFHHIHELDFLQAIMGPAVSVSTAGGNLAHSGEGFGDEDDVLLVTLEFAGGTVGTMQYGSGFRWGEHFVKINGTEGAILLDMEQSSVILKKGKETIRFGLNDTSEEDAVRMETYQRKSGGVFYGTKDTALPLHLGKLMKKEISCFRDAILGWPIEKQYERLFNGSAARSSVATAEAAMNSLREKRWMTIEWSN